MNVNDTAHKAKVKEFCKSVGNLLNTESEYLIEKDLYLTVLLQELQKTKFHENLVFKGGTCLAKVYLDYHRFSEDLDFTWKEQQMFKEKSMKQIRKICSGLIDEIGNTLTKISEKYGFDFKFEKNNRNYVLIGGSNKLVTFRIWFSSIYGKRSLIKVQINFLEDLEFPVETRKLKPLVTNFPKNEEVYFKDFLGFYKEGIGYYAYDIKEIACEKIRTLLTRKIAKTRDIIDLYLIHKKFGVNLSELRKVWLKKIKFAIETYEKYKENFRKRTTLKKEDFALEEITYLLLMNVDKQNFESFVDATLDMLNNETKTLPHP